MNYSHRDSLSDQELVESYTTLLKMSLTPECRQDLWDTAKKYFPLMSAVLLDQFGNMPSQQENIASYHHMLGVSLLFLAIVRVVDAASYEGVFAESTPQSFPGFGYLSSL